MSEDARLMTLAVNAAARHAGDGDRPRCNALECAVLADAVEEAGDWDTANLWRQVARLVGVVTAYYAAHAADWEAPRESAATDSGRSILVDTGRWLSWVINKRTGTVFTGKGRRSTYGKRGASQGPICDVLREWERKLELAAA